MNLGRYIAWFLTVLLHCLRSLILLFSPFGAWTWKMPNNMVEFMGEYPSRFNERIDQQKWIINDVSTCFPSHLWMMYFCHCERKYYAKNTVTLWIDLITHVSRASEQWMEKTYPSRDLKHLRAVESLGISNPLVSRILAVSEFTNQECGT